MAKMVNFLGVNCKVVKHQYHNNGRIALDLIIAEDDEERDLFKGEPMTHATINIAEAPLAVDEVIIKDYSENAGLLDALLKAGIVEKTGRTVQHGFCESHICVVC